AGQPAGTYYLEVYEYHGNTSPDYKLTIVAPGGTLTGGDPFEPNDNFATAANLGPLQGTHHWEAPGAPLAIATGTDHDWFHFQTVAAGQGGNAVTISFDHTRGDVDLELFNSSDTLVAASRGVGDSEQVSLEGLPQGD